MSSADLLEDGFPHSTPEGYRSGCQGHACPGIADNGISCADSFARYQGDYGFRKKVDAGMSPKEIVAAERAAQSAGSEKLDGKPKPRPVKKPTAQPLSEEAQAAIDAATVETVGEAPAKEIPLEKHGTPKGYYLGCRLKDECPGVERVGKSCNQAVNEYQRALKENRKKREAAAAVAAEEVLPVTAVEAVSEHELVGVDADGELCSCGDHEGSVVEHLAAVALALPAPADHEPEEPSESEDAPALDELTALRDRVAELERLLAEASQAQPPAVATLPDGTRVTVVVTVDRAA